MNFLHYELRLSSSNTIEVTLDKQANIRLMDDVNFREFKRGQQHHFYGGRALKSPVHLRAPHSGKWNLVIDLGGYAGQVRASVRTI